MDAEIGDLADHVALVTGASRGVGRGIAHELGLAGATVYVTGRTRAGETAPDGATGTIDGTAQLVSESGGEGIPLAVDHSDDGDVTRMAERVADEQEGVDLLVNNVWGGYEDYDPRAWEEPFHEQSIDRWDRMFDPGVRGHYTTARAVAPLMLDRDRPLIATVSAGDGDRFLGDVPYDVAKAAQRRLAFALHAHLQARGLTSLALLPGFTRTERVLDAFGIGPEAWSEVPELATSHTPRFVGRALVALATVPELEPYAGEAHKVGQLARELGFEDVDGRQPEPWSLPDG